ncbi:hypothetical protein FKW31_09975 [Acetobacter sp. DmW_136]|uniref:hypothetical protein n=1 Tax=Acetobacter sp. DmW_136 TaxID=2591091 RepID=UPI00123C2585|nr:hypothetical protein [Acetobacter sp. DmW_136]KAA8385129.1 hypothetical protein FKW31_09975 [Acetobacter sp. DmW_136]
MTDPRIESAVHAGWQHTTQFKSGMSFAEYQEKEPYAAGELRKAFTAAIRAADEVTPTKSDIAAAQEEIARKNQRITKLEDIIAGAMIQLRLQGADGDSGRLQRVESELEAINALKGSEK